MQVGNKENVTYFVGGEKGGLCERFDLIDSAELHAQIRRWGLGLRWRGFVLSSEKIKPGPWNRSGSPSDVPHEA